LGAQKTVGTYDLHKVKLRYFNFINIYIIFFLIFFKANYIYSSLFT